MKKEILKEVDNAFYVGTDGLNVIRYVRKWAIHSGAISGVKSLRGGFRWK